MMSKNPLDDSVRYVKGVGPVRARTLKNLDIFTVSDLFHHYPFRIEDYSNIRQMDMLKSGDEVTVSGIVTKIGFAQGRRGKVLRVGLSDGTGLVYLVWYGMPYMYKNFVYGKKILASGKVEWRRNGFEIPHPIYHFTTEKTESGPIIPVYHGTGNFTGGKIRKIIKEAFEHYGKHLKDEVPADIMKSRGYLPQSEAIRQIHFPSSAQLWSCAKKSLGFCEMLQFQIALMLMKKANRSMPGPGKTGPAIISHKFLKGLPFCLTPGQARAIEEIDKDLDSGMPMNRLLQGDVGSGKTVVAIYALLRCAESGFQSAFLAPTELLAQQHLGVFRKLVGNDFKVGFLSSKVTGKEKTEVLDKLAHGEIQVLIGTHAILEPGVTWNKLGLVVTDEQHRFGVRQRTGLISRSQCYIPHLLVMSATPIPRSLALTLFGELDISVIDTIPPGRVPVVTEVLHEKQRYIAYKKILEEIQKGFQAYVVCPLIKEGKTNKKSAESVYEDLKNGLFKNIEVGLIHGSMDKEQVHETMLIFVENEIKVLVSTTVIEVGVDVENATCMVVEDADSFGLASLHQLRGRVGRGKHKSYCYYISHQESANPRLNALKMTNDGFKLSQIDLELRGPGQFFGYRQHGLAEIDIKAMDLDLDTIRLARDEAKRIMESKDYPNFLNFVSNRFSGLLKYAFSR